MASGGVRVDIDGSHNIFIGEDRTLQIDVNQSDGTTAQTMTGWALTWELLDKSGGTVQLTKTVAGGGISIGNGDGTDDRATVTIADGDTEGLSGGPGVYWHVLRRTDAGSEAVIAYGTFHLKGGSI